MGKFSWVIGRGGEINAIPSILKNRKVRGGAEERDPERWQQEKDSA